jgi:methyltransferase-like protein
MTNKETIHLSLTPQEADSLAYVLMTSLHAVTMLDRERTDAAAIANATFEQLGYEHGTNENGERVEWDKNNIADKTRG